MRALILVLLSWVVTPPLMANEVAVVQAEFVKQGQSWTVHTTLRHDDSGWDHYADAWRVVGADGTVYGTRTLFHPHEDEQPFTRSESGIVIPDAVTTVWVEAHDKVHGWSKDRLAVDLHKTNGPRFSVRR